MCIERPALISYLTSLQGELLSGKSFIICDQPILLSSRSPVLPNLIARSSRFSRFTQSLPFASTVSKQVKITNSAVVCAAIGKRVHI